MPITNLMQNLNLRVKLKKLSAQQTMKKRSRVVSTKHNQSLYCHYHQEQGHTTEDCRNLWDHLDQFVREGKLKSLLHHSSGQRNQTSSDPQKNAPSRPPLGTIKVIFAALERIVSYPSRVMSMA